MRDAVIPVEVFCSSSPRVAEARYNGLTHPADLPAFDQCIKDHFAGRSEYVDVEHRIRAKSGDWKWILTRGKVVERDGRNHPLRVVGTILDITE
ncbi:MAG: PAS domain-containing protein [Thermodesulfobacteriota bacterium]